MEKAMKETNYVHVDEGLLNAVSNGWYHAPHEVLAPTSKTAGQPFASSAASLIACS